MPQGSGAPYGRLVPDGALPDGALPDGALPDGALPDRGLWNRDDERTRQTPQHSERRARERGVSGTVLLLGPPGRVRGAGGELVARDAGDRDTRRRRAGKQRRTCQTELCHTLDCQTDDCSGKRTKRTDHTRGVSPSRTTSGAADGSSCRPHPSPAPLRSFPHTGEQPRDRPATTAIEAGCLSYLAPHGGLPHVRLPAYAGGRTDATRRLTQRRCCREARRRPNAREATHHTLDCHTDDCQISIVSFSSDLALLTADHTLDWPHTELCQTLDCLSKRSECGSGLGAGARRPARAAGRERGVPRRRR